MELKIPLQVTGLIPPGKPDGSGRTSPETKISSLPEIGTVVVQVLLLNVVVAQVALGLKIITPSGTLDEKALEITVWAYFWSMLQF